MPKKPRVRKEGSKPLGRPKKRNPDGTLVHPPKLKKVASDKVKHGIKCKIVFTFTLVFRTHAYLPSMVSAILKPRETFYYLKCASQTINCV